MQTIYLGGGCFWCTQAVFKSVKGVSDAVCGYAGGNAETANYEDVCTSETDHVEVIKVTFDEQVISTQTVLDIFFSIHNPTTLNQQGVDVGPQYASAIFYENQEQQHTAHTLINSLKETGINVVTRVEQAPTFYDAEEYHQDYFAKNPNQGYCNAAIPPKLAKLRSNHREYFIG